LASTDDFFDWDEANIRHIARHNVTPEEAEQVILGYPLDLEVQFSGQEAEEVRYLQLGATASGRVLQVLSTWRGDKTRIISAWEAPARLKLRYWMETR
jgi:uncharacterized DUF497 family protein